MAAGKGSHTHRAFLLCNYALLGAASSCIFLTLSLRLLPSPCGVLLLFLHALTAGAVALLAFTRTSDFLAELQSYVRDDDAAVILKMVGGLGTAIFVLEWAALALAFSLRLDDDDGAGDYDNKNWAAASYHGNVAKWSCNAVTLLLQTIVAQF
uniref:Uncharacterized protein n=1 Tax=Oryza barthii TaxID=65489 RepID=A0A0D3EXC5_9ORYZ